MWHFEGFVVFEENAFEVQWGKTDASELGCSGKPDLDGIRTMFLSPPGSKRPWEAPNVA